MRLGILSSFCLMHKHQFPRLNAWSLFLVKRLKFIISMKNKKNTWLRNGLEVLTFQSLLQHLRYFYHPDPHWNTFGFSKPAVYSKEVFIHGNTVFCYLKTLCYWSWVHICCVCALTYTWMSELLRTLKSYLKHGFHSVYLLVWRHVRMHLMCWSFFF